MTERMRSTEAIVRNLELMLVQVRKQLELTGRLLDEPGSDLANSIRSTEAYIDTQKSMIENSCFELVHRAEGTRQVDEARAIAMIAGNLERIADFAVNITRQIEHIKDLDLLRRFDTGSYIRLLLDGIDAIPAALDAHDSAAALRICRIEDEVDQLYGRHFREIIETLRNTQHVEDPMTTLFILHYLERMGDALLNIGEAILFAVLGERLKIQQYRVLDDALAASPEIANTITKVELDSFWGTRSGVRVGMAQDHPEEGTDRKVVFKEGSSEKLEREKDSLQRWESVAPGLVPSVVEFKRREHGAAMLLQFLDGVTFQSIVLNADAVMIRNTLQHIEETLGTIWTKTRTAVPVPASFIRQLRKRLPDVFRLHPEFRGRKIDIGHHRLPRIDEMIETAAEIERELAAPFMVFSHGDFNVDNIIWDGSAHRLYFVDVHRSGDMDYVQDVSVFLVSNFRQPVFVPAIRRRIDGVCLEFLRFARQFAQQHDDALFEVRLALGLIRSFTTSTRFELNRKFARMMFQRATLLLNRVTDHRGQPWSAFRVPENVLVY